MWKKWLVVSVFLLSLIGGAKSQQFVADSEPDQSNGGDVVPSESGDYKLQPFGCDETKPSVPSEEKTCLYMMSMLAVLRSGEKAQVFLKLQCEEPVRVAIAFKMDLMSTTVYEDDISANNDSFTCKDFPVPKVDKQQVAYMTLSIIGATVNIQERKTVAVDRMPETCIVQTDSGLYAPGDTVKCRMFCIDFNLKPIKPDCDRIYYVDQNGARAVQILNPAAKNGLITVEFQISENTPNGYHRVEFIRRSGETVTKYFQVETYLPPRFNSIVTCPNNILVSEKFAEVGVFAEYVYKKPLVGDVIMSCVRQVKYVPPREKNCLKGLQDITVEYKATLDASGRYTHRMDLEPLKILFSEYENYIRCAITVKEDGTGVLDTKECYMYISRQQANLQFDYSHDSYYKAGLPFPISVTLTNQNGDPMSNEVITIAIDGVEIKKVITNAEGIAKCRIDTTSFVNPNYTISASFQREDQCYATNQQSIWIPRGFAPDYPYYHSREFPTVDRTIYRTYSETNCFLQIVKQTGKVPCNKPFKIEVQYKLTKAGVGEGKTSTTFFYMVKSKQSIVLHGKHTVELTACLKGSFQVELPITHECAHSAEVIFVGLMKKEIITDSMQLNVEQCFQNQVSLTFTVPVVEPGSEVQQNITGAPGSICAVMSRDISVDLLSWNNDITADDVFYSLQYYMYGMQLGELDLKEPKIPCEDANKVTYCNGRYWSVSSSTTDGDANRILELFSIVVASNCRSQKVQVCGMETEDILIYKAGAEARLASFDAAGGAPPTISTFRTNFDRVFMFLDAILGPDGKETVTGRCPDTITTWRSYGFCMSEKEGLGLAKEKAEMTTMLPMFVDTSAPRWCTRGEKLLVDVTAVNYMDKCTEPEITLQTSDACEVKPYGEDGKPCICKGERTTKTFLVICNKIGVTNFTASVYTKTISDKCGEPHDASQSRRNDTMIRGCDVQPDGIKQEVTTSFQEIVNDFFEKEIALPVLENPVEGSCTTKVQVVGDFIALNAAYLSNLLTQPDGCCEQKTAKLLPVIYMLEYFQHTGIPLDEKVYNGSIKELNKGYQGLLGCRRGDGTVSVFPGANVPNLWMTVRMLYVFAKLRPHTFVDENLIPAMISQLAQRQNLSSGCFNPVGSSFNYQSEKNKDVCFTANVVSRLSSKELRNKSEPLLEGARRCLKAADIANLDTFTLSYVYHAASVADLTDIRNSAFTELKSRAIYKGGKRYWSHKNIPTEESNYFHGFSSAEVDMTARVLSGILLGSEVDRDYCSAIAAFLSSCRNSKGGFPSSQDTESATQAMIEYAKLTYVKETNCEVVVSHENTEYYRISVTKKNRFVVQSKTLPFTSGNVKVSINGTCSSLVQVIYTCHIQIINENSPFTLSVTPRPGACSAGIARVVSMDVCIKYRGDEDKSKMVLLAIKSFSGYDIDLRSAYELVDKEVVSQVQYEKNYLYFYWYSIKRDAEICLPMTYDMQSRVLENRRATITAAHYYERGGAAFTTLSHPCSPNIEEE